MNALFGVGVVSAVVFGILVDGTFFKIYFAVLAIYTIVCNYILIDRSHITKRKNISVTSWGAPDDPHAYMAMEYDVSKTLQYIKKVK